MNLAELLRHVPALDVAGDVSRDVHRVTRDSRDVDLGSIFVAIQGATFDGHDVVKSLGAVVSVVERPVEAALGAVVVRVADSRVALGQLAAALHGWPARGLRVVGVTGTNGKTTVTTIVEHAWRAAGRRCARVGTTGWSVDGEPRSTRFTTPEAPDLQALLAELRDRDIERLAIEISSIGLSQHRVEGVQLQTAVFTNLTRDHLDFHGTFEEYRRAKARIFDLLRPTGGAPRALLCRDDPAWSVLGAPCDAWTYGRDTAADVVIRSIRCGAEQMDISFRTPAGDTMVCTPLVGAFNALNLGAALGILLLDGLKLDEAAAALGSVPGVPGRLEVVPNPRGVRVLVDYAHTDDALAQVLGTVREVTEGEVWVVFGCGGDRDATKRSLMGGVASRLADRVVVTSDNPRTEDPLHIIGDILSGIADGVNYDVEPNREEAIRLAVSSAAPGDVVLIAGKGHETTQTIGTEVRPFDDRLVAARVGRGE